MMWQNIPHQRCFVLADIPLVTSLHLLDFGNSNTVASYGHCVYTNFVYILEAILSISDWSKMAAVCKDPSLNPAIL